MAMNVAPSTTNIPGTPLLEPNLDRNLSEASVVDDYILDALRRDLALQAIVAIAKRKQWNLWACHVRSTHVHTVITANNPADRVMNDLKAAISRRLNKEYPLETEVIRWTRHGSTRYLWNPENVDEAVQYAVEGQGDVMAVFDGRKIPSHDGR